MTQSHTLIFEHGRLARHDPGISTQLLLCPLIRRPPSEGSETLWPVIGSQINAFNSRFRFFARFRGGLLPGGSGSSEFVTLDVSPAGDLDAGDLVPERNLLVDSMAVRVGLVRLSGVATAMSSSSKWTSGIAERLSALELRQGLGLKEYWGTRLTFRDGDTGDDGSGDDGS